MTFVLLASSFQRTSYTQSLLRVVAILFEGRDLVAPAINELPFYSEDLAHKGRPRSVVTFLRHIKQADAIVVCTPEYNHSIPAVLKNAINWASRPAFHSPLRGISVTLITQSMSTVGGARAHAHLKLTFDSMLSRVHLCHELVVSSVVQAFDAKGVLIDESIRERIGRHLSDFIRFNDRLRPYVSYGPFGRTGVLWRSRRHPACRRSVDPSGTPGRRWRRLHGVT
jgi:chromate reductase, NAD(P)H dehydrogenase (quinone)